MLRSAHHHLAGDPSIDGAQGDEPPVRWLVDLAVRAPAHQALGTQFVLAHGSCARVALAASSALVSDPDTGTLASGVLISLLDHATGLALAQSLRGRGTTAGTVDLRVDFMGQAVPGDVIEVQGTCHRLLEQVATVTGLAWCRGRRDDVIARATGTYALDWSVPADLSTMYQAADVVLHGRPGLVPSAGLAALVRDALSTRDFSEIARGVPYFAFLGLEVESVATGLVTHLPGWEQHIGSARRRTLHGGVLGAQLEATAVLQLLAQDPDVGVGTVNVDFDFLRPVQVGPVHARAIVVRRGRRLATVRCEAWQEDPSRLVVVSRGTFQLCSGRAAQDNR
jgi:uncharacterized protein (TIGR00369 family)